MKFTDTKVFDTSEGLYSIHGSFRYFTAADQITFCASFFLKFFFHNIYLLTISISGYQRITKDSIKCFVNAMPYY